MPGENTKCFLTVLFLRGSVYLLCMHTGRGSDSLVLIEAGGFYPKFYGMHYGFVVNIGAYI